MLSSEPPSDRQIERERLYKLFSTLVLHLCTHNLFIPMVRVIAVRSYCSTVCAWRVLLPPRSSLWPFLMLMIAPSLSDVASFGAHLCESFFQCTPGHPCAGTWAVETLAPRFFSLLTSSPLCALVR